MAASTANVGRQSPIDDDDGFVYVFDRREKDAPEVKIPTGGLFSFNDFKERVKDVSKAKMFWFSMAMFSLRPCFRCLCLMWHFIVPVIFFYFKRFLRFSVHIIIFYG